MHNSTVRSKAQAWRIATTGAALAAAFATLGMAGTASAADVWAATTKATATFRCVSNCQAGGIGAVTNGATVQPAKSTLVKPGIGAWERTVRIYCKTNTMHQSYHVTVQDKNWSGTWQVDKSNFTRAIDDSKYPVC